MKQFFHKLTEWWFATMVPVHNPLTTIVEREKLRKRRLLSILVFISFVFTLGGAPLGLFATELQRVIVYSLSIIAVPTLWINQRGSLIGASLFYLFSASFLEMALIVNEAYSIPSLAVYVWPILLVSLVTVGFFLPAWGLLLLGMIITLFLCWFMLVGCQTQISLYIVDPHIRTTMLTFSCIIVVAITIFSAISSLTTSNAVIQADRATELEQAHQSLSNANEKLETALARIQKQALTDPLTNLPNHRAVMDQLAKELEQAQRYDHVFSLLFFDADRFKQVNDLYGHAAGDAVLCQIGERAGSVLRGADILGRFGGEEFVILLPETDLQEARVVAERLRAAVAAEPMATAKIEGGVAMTLSIGLSTYGDDGISEQDLLSQADAAMYMAKRMGRNQVRLAEEVQQAHANGELLAL